MKKYVITYTPETNLEKITDGDKTKAVLTLMEGGVLVSYAIIDEALIGTRETNIAEPNSGEVLLSAVFAADYYKSKVRAEENARQAIKDLADAMSIKAKNYIAGFNLTQDQLDRYEDKYQAVLAYNESGAYEAELTMEAELDGLTLEEFCGLILNLNTAYRTAMRTFNLRIEIGRRTLNKLLETREFDKVYGLVGELHNFGATSTIEDLKTTIEKYL